MPRIFFRCLILFSWALSTPVLAQFGHYSFTRLDNSNGLSHNQVNTIFKDKKGFVWFGTLSGLNRYDGYTFKIFRSNRNDPASLSDNFITKLMEGPDGNMWVLNRNSFNIYNPVTESFTILTDQSFQEYGVPNIFCTDIQKDFQNNYWFVHQDSGLYKFYPSENRTVRYASNRGTIIDLASNNISSISIDHNENLWVIHSNGIFERINLHKNQITLRDSTFFSKELTQISSFVDRDGDLWLYYNEFPRGIYFYDTRKDSLSHYHRNSQSIKLNNNNIRGITQDDKEKIWVGTDHGGINLINKKDLSVRYLLNQQDNDKSLSQNSIYSLYKDNAGIIWIGTYKKGLNFYHENIYKFHINKPDDSENIFIKEDVNCFAEDGLGNLWIGTNGGGLYYYDRQLSSFKAYKHNPSDPFSISSNVIVNLYVDKDKKLWVGTYYGGLNSFDGQKFTQFKHDPKNEKSISDDRVWEIYEDSQNNFWVGTLGGGLNLFDRENNVFHRFKVDDEKSIHSNYIFSIIEDKEGHLYIGTAFGLDIREKGSDEFTHYRREYSDCGLSNDNIFAVMEDSRGLVWVGTREGLNLFDKRTKKFSVLNSEDGLQENTVLSIKEDDNGHLWLSTPNGISRVSITKNPGKDTYSLSFRNYDKSDGLQGSGFNERAALKTRKGELAFGGVYGFNLFHPQNLETNQNLPEIVFTDFQIFNKSIKAGEEVNGRVLLHMAIAEVPEITLKHNENVFSIEFAALSYFHPDKNKYAYKLEGFNTDWLYTDDKIRKATYTNLDPGEYTFKVKASNNDGIWNDKSLELKLTVLPPFWKTKAAMAIYFFVIIGALLVSRHLIQLRERLKFEIKQEREEARRTHELDLMKIKFFTNVSHEFRTPLSLILAPLEKILNQTSDEDQKNQFQMIHRNAKRLLNLVNQLLDFRKIEVQSIKLNPSEGDVVKFLQDITYSFSDLSEKKKIHFSFQSSVESLQAIFDQDKLEKILFNLLSNAFKFTPEYGEVRVLVSIKNQASRIEDEINWLEIKVVDTGIGIPADKHEAIFERFFQNDIPGSFVNQGSGIGLSITKEFVKLHGGTINVESSPDKGSCFIINLPLKQIFARIAPASEVKHTFLEPEPVVELAKEEPQTGKKRKRPLIMVVEDNEDFRFYIKDNLSLYFDIIESSNGIEGLKKIQQSMPDLIVSDVMMPGMDGIELCRKIKANRKTSHIPMVLLTARAADEQKMQGFEIGANDYITKPFNFEILLSRIKNILKEKEAQQKNQTKIEVTPDTIEITSLDGQLLKKAVHAVEKHISDAEFSVNDLSRELGMSRVHLYKKILALTGESPIEFIRNIRLKRAAQLLEESQLTVSEIAYEVGFNNPKYFTKYFKAVYKTLPSNYKVQSQNFTN